MRPNPGDSEKVTGYESEYFDSLDLGSYVDTSETSDADDAKWHKSKDIYYDPNVPLEDFYLDLRFENLKLFKLSLLVSQLGRVLSFNT